MWVRLLQTVGSVAEWSKALVLGTSLFGGVGSNPTAAILFFTPIISSWHLFVFAISNVMIDD